MRATAPTAPIALAALATVAGLLSLAAVAEAPLDLDDPAVRADALLRTRGSADPAQEVVFHWSGTIHAVLPAGPDGAPPALPLAPTDAPPLLRFEGFNIARFVPLEGGEGHRMLSRELAVYRDPATGAILDCWPNPTTGARVSVLPVLNDPVNVTFGDARPEPVNDGLRFTFTIPLAYPSPLPVAEYPAYSADDTYRSTEYFELIAPRAPLADPTVASAPTTLRWQRVGPWLPWMQMGDRPGWLAYRTEGGKLAGGFDALPDELRRFVAERAPGYAHAPAADDGRPNETTWTVFRDRLLDGSYSPACPADPID